MSEPQVTNWCPICAEREKKIETLSNCLRTTLSFINSLIVFAYDLSPEAIRALMRGADKEIRAKLGED